MMDSKILINDERLTPTMERLRSGRTQLFREKNKNDRAFISSENCDVKLEHENKAMYAELIEGKWYWINGCAECNGKKRGWETYIECEKHDVCCKCSTPRKEIKGCAWGGPEGWTCETCHDIERKEIRRMAFEKFKEDCLDESDFYYMDEIKCPHCGSEISSDDIHESQDITCEVCEGEIELKVEYTTSYSTSIKGKRITK